MIIVTDRGVDYQEDVQPEAGAAQPVPEMVRERRGWEPAHPAAATGGAEITR